MKTIGKLFSVRVGPGDPELLTIKAVRVIKEADIFFTAATSKSRYSLVAEIAKPYISTSAKVKKLSFPMTKDEKVVEEAWINNAKQIATELKKGKNALFLTLGDPTTYSTFGYI